jgi:hypothetical protein
MRHRTQGKAPLFVIGKMPNLSPWPLLATPGTRAWLLGVPPICRNVGRGARNWHVVAGKIACHRALLTLPLICSGRFTRDG